MTDRELKLWVMELLVAYIAKEETQKPSNKYDHQFYKECIDVLGEIQIKQEELNETSR